MKKSLSFFLLAVTALMVVGCNAGETPTVEVQTQKPTTPTGAPGAGAPQVPAGAQSGIPSNAVPPPPKTNG